MKQVLRCSAVAMTMALLGACAAPMESSPGDDEAPETVGVEAEALTSVAFSTYLGGSGVEFASRPAVDSAGNVYVTGRTTTYGTGGDIFVAKLSSAGALIYFTYFGGSASEVPAGIAVDAAGNTYVVASTTSYSPSADILVAKLNAAGTALLYSTFFGGTGPDEPYGIAIDGAGNAYVTGETDSIDYPTTAGAFQTKRRGQSDAFVTKLNAAGNALVYSTYLGGDGFDYAMGIAVDASGFAYVAGRTSPLGSVGSFPTTAGAYRTLAAGMEDAFVTKLVPSGSSLSFSTYLGGSATDRANAIAIDSGLNVYVTGDTTSHNFPVTPGALRTTHADVEDAFVTKLNASGNSVSYSTYLGGSSGDLGTGIAVNSAGNAYVTGWTLSNDFPATPGAFRSFSGGGNDSFVTELSVTGSALMYSTYAGGSGVDLAFGIAVNGAGNAYVGGTTTSANFPVSSAAQSVFAGGQDAFVLKIAGP